MNAYLRNKILSPETSSTKSTIAALVNRGLCTINGNLTERGITVSISLLTLEKQCDIMNIPLENIVFTMDKQTCPEVSVLKHLINNFQRAYYTENAFGVSIVQFFMFKYQYDIALKHKLNLYSISFTDGDCERYFIYEELLNNLDYYIEQIKTDTIYENYQLIQSLNRQYSMKYNISFDENYQVIDPLENEFVMTYFYQDLDDIDFYKSLYLDLGKEFMKKLIKFVIYNPSVYRIGWPDIFVLDNEPYFIEVKTTDKFHMSQIITVRDIIKILGIPVRCFRIKSEEPSNK